MASLIVLFGMVRAAQAATITVTSTADSGAGSLRAALVAANATTAADIIAFNIPGSGPFTIAPTSAYPVITQPLTINGYTQPGASANSVDEGDNASILVRIDGFGAGATSSGFFICADSVTIRGLSLTRFQQAGINVGDNSGTDCNITPAGTVIDGNFIGLEPDGRSAAGQRFAGIRILRASATLVGGSTPAARNVISSNGTFGTNSVTDGVFVSNATTSNTTINGNYIGTDASGVLDRGNARGGVRLGGSTSGVIVGGVPGNVIAFNREGIAIDASVVGATITGNDIAQNDNLGIDLCAPSVACPDGITGNDLNDADTGGNNLQNFPVLSTATRVSGGLQLTGTLDRVSTAGTRTYTIAAFASASCVTGGNREGERFLGSFNFASASPAAQAYNGTVATTRGIPVGSFITLTATDQGTGDTSEFSACFALDNPTALLVTSVADTDGTTCGANCTLRQAINVANATPGGDSIAFDVASPGPFQLLPATALPTITDALTIDGYTQPGSSPNTSATADNAVITALLNGSGIATGIISGLGVCASNVTIRGLSIVNFPGQGINLGGTSTGGACAGGPFVGGVVAGNFVGLTLTSAAAGNGFTGIVVSRFEARIGGTLPADRNVIGANGSAGIAVGTSSPASIDGNLIGTDATAALDRGNGQSGIFLSNGDTTTVTIGAAARNLIRFNREGIRVNDATSHSSFAANDIFGNDNLGIDLVATGGNPDGVTNNDVDDADSGGNNLQNFPVLATASLVGSTIVVTGSLDVPLGSPTQAQRISLYASAACDSPSAHGEGELYLGTVSRFVTNATENFTISLVATAPLGSRITATTTFNESTSEFSPCVTLVDGDLLLRNGFE